MKAIQGKKKKTKSIFAKRVQNITPSLTLSITAKAKQLKEEGRDVVAFSAGEPDFDTPEPIKRAAIDALNKGFTKYTPESGTLDLRKAISEKLEKENGLAYRPEQVIVSCGAKHSIFNVIQVLVDKGDEVIIPGPFWLSYPEMVTIAGGKSVFLKSRLEDEYRFTPQALKKAITSRTKLLILNSPSNPTGAVYPVELFQEVIKIAKKYSFYILSDEIYEKLVFDGRKHCSIGALDPEILNRTITVGGASKAHAMTGWRLGFAACPIDIAKACSSLQSHSTSNPTSFAQVGYLEALKNGNADVQKMRESFEKRRNLIYSLVGDIPKLRAFKPQATFYLFVDIRQTGLRSLEFAERILEEAQVALVPGIAFGDDHAIRLSFAISEEAIRKGIQRIGDWVKRL